MRVVDSSILSLTTSFNQAIRPVTCGNATIRDRAAVVVHAFLRPLRTAVRCPMLHVDCTAHSSGGGGWSPVVDEPQRLVMHSCRFAPKPTLSCVFVSHQFSPLHPVSGAHVPSMCPAWMSSGLTAPGGSYPTASLPALTVVRVGCWFTPGPQNPNPYSRSASRPLTCQGMMSAAHAFVSSR